jgi:hypothetical protein
MARTHTFRTLTPRGVDYGAHPQVIPKYLGVRRSRSPWTQMNIQACDSRAEPSRHRATRAYGHGFVRMIAPNGDITNRRPPLSFSACPCAAPAGLPPTRVARVNRDPTRRVTNESPDTAVSEKNGRGGKRLETPDWQRIDDDAEGQGNVLGQLTIPGSQVRVASRPSPGIAPQD